MLRLTISAYQQQVRCTKFQYFECCWSVFGIAFRKNLPSAAVRRALRARPRGRGRHADPHAPGVLRVGRSGPDAISFGPIPEMGRAGESEPHSEDGKLAWRADQCEGRESESRFQGHTATKWLSLDSDPDEVALPRVASPAQLPL